MLDVLSLRKDGARYLHLVASWELMTTHLQHQFADQRRAEGHQKLRRELQQVPPHNFISEYQCEIMM